MSPSSSEFEAGAETEGSAASIESVVLPTIGTLLATGAAASLVCRSPDEPFANWGQLMTRAVEFVVLAGAVHAVAVWVVERVYGGQAGWDSEVTAGRVARGTWLAAGLLPVTVLLAHAGSEWSAVVLPVIAVVAVLFVRRAVPGAGRLARSGAPAGIASGLFRYEAPAALLRTLRTMVLVAVMLELGAVMLLSWEYELAGLLFGLCVMVMLWRVPLRGRAAERRDGRGRVWVSTTVVLGLTVVTLMPSLGRGRLRVGVSRLLGVAVVHPTPAPPGKPGRAFSGVLSGVILTLPPRPREKLMVLPVESSPTIGKGVRREQTIPFDGVYWYFRAPELGPRVDARRVRGDPTKVDIHSTDMVALAMEAHQRLGTPLQTDCCGAIRVAMRNAEAREGAIGVELVLADDAPKGGWRRSLGMKTLRSSLAPHREGMDEVVEFPVPRDLPRGVMDEMTVMVVVPAGERARRAARVGVESFQLVGR